MPRRILTWTMPTSGQIPGVSEIYISFHNLHSLRSDYMHSFLLYGRQLSQKELDKLDDNESSIKKQPPGLDQFGAQIDHYEGLHEEVKALDNTLTLQGWFRADVTPFKHALMNCIKRWSYAFKKHLLDHLMKSLNDLDEFIEKADEALMAQVHEGDYEGLIKMMEYLSLVEDDDATNRNTLHI